MGETMMIDVFIHMKDNNAQRLQHSETYVATVRSMQEAAQVFKEAQAINPSVINYHVEHSDDD